MTDTAAVTPESARNTSTRQQIRGSSLLMAGRFISLGANFVVQILIVRYLTQSDYGAFAYALSLVALGESVITFGLDRAVTRFVPIYDEQRDFPRLWGTLFMVFGTILAFSVGLLLIFWAFRDYIGAELIADQQAFALLSIMILLAPIQALDTLFNGLFAVFSSPFAIFFRKYMVGPGLRILVVVLLILTASDVEFLAAGYLLAGLLIVVVFGILLAHILQTSRLLATLNVRKIKFPVREVLAFTVPLLASDLLYVVMGAVDAVMLERFSGVVGVAEFRAVLPMARMNQVVLASFALLYTPAAARLFARKDYEGINNLYWQNAIWSMIISFPIFALTFSLAQPLTVTLIEQRYADSSVIMALLSLGFYFDAALGQNGLTLKVMGKIRYIVVVYTAAAILSVVLNLIFIPPLGALGAALGTLLTLVIFNIMKQAGLMLGTGINIFDQRYRSAYASVAVSALLLLAIQLVFAPPFIISLIVAAAVALMVIKFNRAILDVENTFPELLRIPGARWLVGV